MWVLHPSHGLGQIVALSGTADRRRATIDFQPPAGRKTLLLALAPLQPVAAAPPAAPRPEDSQE